MKAIFFEQHGGPEVLKYGDVPDPTPKLGEALIRVRAAALNHLDIWVRRGWKGLHLEMPHITGCDVAGEIVSVNGSSQWKAGERVLVNPGICTVEDEWTRRGEDSISPGYKILGEQLRGGLAELVAVPIRNVYKIPEGISFEEAAAPLLVGVTTWRMLYKRADLRPGESVLVVGSGGGVNSLTISLATKTGATVYALAGSAEKAKRAKELGAIEAINYNEVRDWPIQLLKMTKGRGVDVVVDNVGQATISKSLRCVARGGRIVTVGNTSGYELTFDNRFIFAKQVSILGSTMGNSQDFVDVLEFMWQHDIKPIIDRVEPLKNGIEMLSYLERGEQFGKIVLKP
jgi:NADPH:quinone reductase-like Zn-dependent oxidoreductase